MGVLDSIDVKRSSEQGAILSILQPGTDEFIGILIKVAGPESSVYRNTEDGQTNRIFAARPGQVTLTAEKVRSNTRILAARTTMAWWEVLKDENGNFKTNETADKDTPDHELFETKDTITLDGSELACNEANAEKLYRKHPWIMEQVRRFQDNIANFMPKE